MIRRPPRSTLFPYTRSSDLSGDQLVIDKQPCRGEKGVIVSGVIAAAGGQARATDRKSTRLNSSHANISYAVFCLQKKSNYIRSSHLDQRDMLARFLRAMHIA